MNDDITNAIKPKSDQKNADDFIAGDGTFTITRVTFNEKAKEQPVWVYLDDDPKPWKPCKGMMRVMGKFWDKHCTTWVGKRLTLYRDDRVTWGGAEVGGIRISHMSDIGNEPRQMALSISQRARQMHTVYPLGATQPPKQKKQATAEEKAAKAQAIIAAILKDIDDSTDVDATMAKHADMLARIKGGDAAAAAIIEAAANKRRAELAAPGGQG